MTASESLEVQAQSSGVTWSVPVNLSESPEGSYGPAIVADDYGYVHVLWSEDTQGTGGKGDMIMYRCWDGQQWTEPVDVLLVPGQTIAYFVAVDVGPQNHLHIVWTAQSQFYYSSAPASQAYLSRAWREPVVIAGDNARSQLESDITVDASGNLYVAYATRGQASGVYVIRSADQGETWSLPVLLSDPLGDLEQGYSNVKLVDDPHGRLHAVWQTFQQDGFPQAPYYSRSTDQGETWEPALQLGYRESGDYGAGWPYVVSRGDSELHLIYLNGHGTDGRFHRISRDGGQTWSAPVHIITDMEGLNGYVIPVVDSAQNLHLVINMRPVTTQVTGIYYARWNGTDWSEVVPVATEEPYVVNPHRADAAVRLGNELHVVYRNQGDEIWHVLGVVEDAEHLEPRDSVVITANLTPTPLESTTVPIHPVTEEMPQGLDREAPNSAPSALYPLLIGSGSALLLVMLAFMWMLKRTR